MPTRKPRKARASTSALSRRNDVMGAVLGTPWAISPAGLESILLHAERELLGDRSAIDSREGDPVDHSWRLTKRDGVAQLRVYGPLVSADSWMSYYFPSYQSLSYEITSALADPSIGALVLTFASPGGHVNGCQELAALLQAQRGGKPIVAFVEGDACSAAYWIASACDEVVVAETSVLGCLGCQVAYLDDSKMLENWGLREITITSSQTPEKNRAPIDDAGRASWQQMVDDLADVFLNSVASNRGVPRETVDAQFGRGAVLVGARAVTAGLADRIGTYETLHAELASGAWRTARNSNASTSAAAAALTHIPEARMPAVKKPAAAGTPRVVAAAFESGADVRVLVTRDVAVAEGDVGAIAEVRDGSFYRVGVGDSDYAWLAEDEIEAAPAATDSAPSDTPAADTTASRGVNALQRALAGARSAEKARITGILAFANKVPMAALQTLIDDDACTPEIAAHRLISGTVKGVNAGALSAFAGDEVDLQANGGITTNADGATAQTDAERILATTAQFNPRAVARKPRG